MYGFDDCSSNIDDLTNSITTSLRFCCFSCVYNEEEQHRRIEDPNN